MKRILLTLLLSLPSPFSMAENTLLYNGTHFQLKNGEVIYIRKAGHGLKKVILLPGNNTSGAIFEPILSFVRSIDAINDNYTFYTFDYRGSGFSSYNTKITSLKDFAKDFDEIVHRSKDFKNCDDITLVGYSMGFGVAIEMLALDPSIYKYIISLAGIGTRGIRIYFGSKMTNLNTGKTYNPGDWVDNLDAVRLQQMTWQGESRTFENVKNTWNMMVFNDYMKFSLKDMKPSETKFMENPFYMRSLEDVLTIEYMPESLYYSHMFNASFEDITHKNSDGTIVKIPGSKRVKYFKDKKVLLVKAHTDYKNWRGDLVVTDEIFRNTKYDIKHAGGYVNAVIIDSDQGWDHGFPVTHPLQVLKLIIKFIQNDGNIGKEDIKMILNDVHFTFFPHEEAEWESEEFLGF